MPEKRIAQLPVADVVAALARGRCFVDYGACMVRVRANGVDFADAFRHVYGAFPFIEERDFSDFHVRLVPGAHLRRWLRPTARFCIDGVEPFEPFPRASVLPLYEWGVNWCFGQRCNQYVLLHAGTLALGDRAVLMAALPGSGKSTLSAALMLSGFRLLSDEFGVLDPESGMLLPMLKPVALKNRSIDVIRGFSSRATLGPVFPETRKGDVAHLAPDDASVDALRRAARPSLVIFPKYVEGGALELRPQAPEQAFARLAFNSFNYALLGEVSFNAVADVVEHCQAFELLYGRLDEAVGCLHALMADAEACA